MRNPDARHKYTWRCKRRRPRRRLSENRQPRGDLMASDLKGKAVLITGASTGIGAAAARAFARLGSHVVVHYNASRDAAEKVAADVRSLGGEAVLVGGDVTQIANIKRIVGEAQSALGRIDVLINNAGGLVARTRIEDYTEQFLQQ